MAGCSQVESRKVSLATFDKAARGSLILYNFRSWCSADLGNVGVGGAIKLL